MVHGVVRVVEVVEVHGAAVAEAPVEVAVAVVAFATKFARVTDIRRCIVFGGMMSGVLHHRPTWLLLPHL